VTSSLATAGERSNSAGCMRNLWASALKLEGGVFVCTRCGRERMLAIYMARHWKMDARLESVSRSRLYLVMDVMICRCLLGPTQQALSVR
jgi:hypothetical protein